MFETNSPMYVEWEIRGFNDETGELVYHYKDHNLVVRTGRVNELKNLIGVTPTASSFIFCGVGSGSTAAVVTDTKLETELFNTQSMYRIPFTNTSGVALSGSDITQETSVVGSYTYDQKLVMQASYSTQDVNGYNMREYGLASSNSFASQIFYNRIVASSSLAKDSSISVLVQVTIRK